MQSPSSLEQNMFSLSMNALLAGRAVGRNSEDNARR